jgi:hypothetical protein
LVGALQTVPQLPQLPVSACVLTQDPLQAVSEPQSVAHAPALQNMPLWQLLPQSPQCCAFELVSTQLPEQLV